MPPMFVWTVLAHFGPNGGKKKEEERTFSSSTRVVGFAATKNVQRIRKAPWQAIEEANFSIATHRMRRWRRSGGQE